MRKGCKISENIHVLWKRSSNFSLFSHKMGVKLLKISLEKGPFSILRLTMEYPFFMEVPSTGFTSLQQSTALHCVLSALSAMTLFPVTTFIILS